MRWRVALVVSLIFFASHAAAKEETSAAEETPAARQYHALMDEYKQEGGARAFAKRFLELADQHSQDPVAAEALLWVVKNVRGRSDTKQALERLAEYHVNSEKLGPACQAITNSRSIAAEKLLRSLLQTSTHQHVRAQACYYLADLLDREAVLVEQLKEKPELAPRMLQYYGKDYGQHLASLEPDSLAKQREQLYEQILASFADVPINNRTMGEIAKRALFRIRHLSIGKTAPEIRGKDIQGQEFTLSEYRGKVVMLTFWGHW